MNLVELFLVVLGAIVITALAQRRGLQPALVITVVAFAVSFIPAFPRFELDSHIILGAVLPPLLYSAAQNFSFFTFMRNLRPIVGLGVGLVVITTLVVGGVANWAIPALSLGTALLLGAVVAPPDAVTAVAIGRKLGLPKRVMAILTGESLVNDAAALTLFSITVAAIAGTHTIFANPVLLFLYSAVIGSLVGVALAAFVIMLRRFLHNAGLETVLGLMVPFAAYFIAEELQASGVLAVVMAGFVIGTNSTRFGYETRLQERQVWNSIDVLLEAFVFAYMGLQLRFVIDDIENAGHSASQAFILGGLVLLTVILIRPLMVFLMFGSTWLTRRRLARTLVKEREEEREAKTDTSERMRRKLAKVRGKVETRQPLTWKENLVVSWTGMRGVVTIAAAAGIPMTTAAGDDFPGRAIIQTIAFIVAVGTLLIQGATLPWLIRGLKLEDPHGQAQERADARKAEKLAREAASAVFAEFMANPPEGLDERSMSRIRSAVARQSRSAEELPENQESAQKLIAYDDLYKDVLTRQRARVIAARNHGELGDDAARAIIERFDLQEAALAARIENRL